MLETVKAKSRHIPMSPYKVRRVINPLRGMSARLDVRDVTTFVAAVVQAEQLGVSMAKVLRIQSDQMRIKRRQMAEKKAQEAPVKMVIPMVFLIFPSLMLVLLGPAAFQVLRSGVLETV